MHIISICMHARSGHCAGQAVSYCIYVLERLRKVCKRAKLVGMDMATNCLLCQAQGSGALK